MSNRFAGAAEARSVDFGALGAAMSGMRGGFSDAGPVHFSPAPEPRHFRPANPGVNPTAGWDPFDPMGSNSETPFPEPESIDPVEAARAEGFAEGMAAAGRMAAERGEADAQALAALAATLDSMTGFDRDLLATRLRQTVLFLVTRLVEETGVSPDLLNGRIEAAVALLADSSEAAVLKLNPDDLLLVEGQTPARIALAADSMIERGGFRIETRATSIEDGPAVWLAQLAAAMDRAALPDAA
jgi:flagellar assembly protein FliH